MRRSKRVDHSPQPAFPDGIGAIGAWLGIHIYHALFQVHGAQRLLRVRDRNHLGMPRHVAFARHSVNGFGNDLACTADHRSVGIFALLSRPDRERDTTRHHLPVEFVCLWASHAQPDSAKPRGPIIYSDPLRCMMSLMLVNDTQSVCKALFLTAAVPIRHANGDRQPSSAIASAACGFILPGRNTCIQSSSSSAYSC
jgi:hypothetical protein